MIVAISHGFEYGGAFCSENSHPLIVFLEPFEYDFGGAVLHDVFWRLDFQLAHFIVDLTHLFFRVDRGTVFCGFSLHLLEFLLEAVHHMLIVGDISSCRFDLAKFVIVYGLSDLFENW